MVEGNTAAFKQGAKRRSGKMINQRVVAAIKPRLPFWAKGYVESSFGEAVLANAVAAAAIKYFPANEKVTLAADAMITAAADEFIGSFNIEEMIDDVLDGIDLSTLKDTGDDVRSATANTMRKASDFVEPAVKEA